MTCIAYIKMRVAIDDGKEEDNIEKWNEIEEKMVLRFLQLQTIDCLRYWCTMQSVWRASC